MTDRLETAKPLRSDGDVRPYVPGQCWWCGRRPKRGDVVYRRHVHFADEFGVFQEMATFCVECASEWHPLWLTGEPRSCKGGCGLLVSTPYVRFDPATDRYVPQTEYCSCDCRVNAKRERRPTVKHDERRCANPRCERTFTPARSTQLYCSQACRLVVFRLRKKRPPVPV
jgi:hypothetical protein